MSDLEIQPRIFQSPSVTARASRPFSSMARTASRRDVSSEMDMGESSSIWSSRTLASSSISGSSKPNFFKRNLVSGFIGPRTAGLASKPRAFL